MSNYITKEEWLKMKERMEKTPPMTAEEKEKFEELGRKMRSLSKEERLEIRRKTREEDPFS